MRLVGDFASLRLPKHRLVVLGILSLLILVIPYAWLDHYHITLWSVLGLGKVYSTGLTRAYWQLIHGHPVAAWHRNGLIYPVVSVVAFMLVKDVRALLKARAD